MKLFAFSATATVTLTIIACGAMNQRNTNNGGCTVTKNKEQGSTLKCNDGTSVVIQDGEKGEKGMDGKSALPCTSESVPNFIAPGTNQLIDKRAIKLSCPGSQTVYIIDGKDGTNGKDGKDGMTCTIDEFPSADGGPNQLLFTCVDRGGTKQAFIVKKKN